MWNYKRFALHALIGICALAVLGCAEFQCFASLLAEGDAHCANGISSNSNALMRKYSSSTVPITHPVDRLGNVREAHGNIFQVLDLGARSGVAASNVSAFTDIYEVD